MKNFVAWLNRETIRARLPKDFNHFPRARAIIDCSEVECAVPNDPTVRVKLWSNYKQRHTMKYLVACAPSGEVTFISKMFGGRVTDTEITTKSGFLSLVQHMDDILADKGFPQIETDILQAGGILVMPPFKQDKKGFQFTDAENLRAYRIARVRIHVERCIQRMKVFSVLDYVYSDMREFMDDTVLVISALCNLNKSLIKK